MAIRRRSASMHAGWRMMMSVVLWSLLLSDASPSHQPFLRRQLQTTATQSFEVPIILALHFVSESTAASLETKDPTNDDVKHLCDAVQEQVSETMRKR